MRIPHEFIRHMTAVSRSIPLSRFPLGGIEGGKHPVHRLGMGTDFAEHQTYSPGDDPRYLDWKLFARHASLQTKKFYSDESRMVYLFIDTSGSMDFGTPRKFDYALILAAGIAFLSLQSLDTVNIITGNSRKGEVLLKCRHLSSFPKPIHFLESLKPGGQDADIPSCCRFLTDLHLPPGPIWIFSDFYHIDRWAYSLRFFRFHHFLPLPIRITAQEERSFPHNGNLNLIDLETTHQKKICINENERRKYHRNFQLFSSRIRHAFSSAGIRLWEVATDFPAEKFIIQLLQDNQ